MTSDQSPQESNLGKYAGFVTRLIAWIIDRLIVTAVIAGTVVVAQFVWQSLPINQHIHLGDAARLVVAILAGALAVLFAFSYHIVFWMLAGQTPGKRIMGVRIVRTNGERVRFGTCVKRQLGLLVSAILLLGYLWALVDNRRQAFHDKLAGTFVVYAWPEVQPHQDRPVRDRIRKIEAEDQAPQAAG